MSYYYSSYKEQILCNNRINKLKICLKQTQTITKN